MKNLIKINYCTLQEETLLTFLYRDITEIYGTKLILHYIKIFYILLLIINDYIHKILFDVTIKLVMQLI